MIYLERESHLSGNANNSLNVLFFNLIFVDPFNFIIIIPSLNIIIVIVTIIIIVVVAIMFLINQFSHWCHFCNAS